MKCSRVCFTTVRISSFLLLLGGVGLAQQGEMKRGPFSTTVQGGTGLITIFSADTLRQGEFVFSLGQHNYDRDPGDYDIQVNPVSLTIGLLDRLELFALANVSQSVDFDGKRVPAPVTPSVVPYQWHLRYLPDHPFQDGRSFTNGMGDYMTGLKLNLLSEQRGNPLGLALRGFVKFPSVRKRKFLVRGRGTGEINGGFDLILSKNIGIVGIHYNAGVTFVGDPGSMSVDVLDLRDKLRLGFGLNAPVASRVQAVMEINNITYIGDGTPISGPVNPVDVFGGLRFFLNDWFSISGGYRHFINSTDTDPAEGSFSKDHHGYTVQLAFSHRKNAVPLLQCNIERATILQGDTTRLTALGADADYNATLGYRWTATGGEIEGSGDNVTFNSESLDPGIYTVTVAVSDNRGATSTCSKDIQVDKRNEAPVVSLDCANSYGCAG